MLTIMPNAQQGFHPCRFGPPKLQRPFKQIIRGYHKGPGGVGGQVLLPSVFLPVLHISYQIKGKPPEPQYQ
jgi:hypothetical protein